MTALRCLIWNFNAILLWRPITQFFLSETKKLCNLECTLCDQFPHADRMQHTKMTGKTCMTHQQCQLVLKTVSKISSKSVPPFVQKCQPPPNHEFLPVGHKQNSNVTASVCLCNGCLKIVLPLHKQLQIAEPMRAMAKER